MAFPVITLPIFLTNKDHATHTLFFSIYLLFTLFFAAHKIIFRKKTFAKKTHIVNYLS